MDYRGAYFERLGHSSLNFQRESDSLLFIRLSGVAGRIQPWNPGQGILRRKPDCVPDED